MADGADDKVLRRLDSQAPVINLLKTSRSDLFNSPHACWRAALWSSSDMPPRGKNVSDPIVKGLGVFARLG